MPWPAFEQALARSQELEKLLGDPAVIGDRARYTQLAKEHGALAKKVKPYLEYKKLSADIAQNEALLAAEADADMKHMIDEELAGLRPRQQVLHERLEEILLAGDEDFSSV